MECNKIILFYYCLFIVNFSSSNIKVYASSPKDDSSKRLISDAREIVEKCLTNNSNLIIISADLIDDYDEVKNPSDINNIKSSFIIINEDFKPTKIEGHIPAYPTYVLLFKSFLKLAALIEELRKSKIWSIKSPFLVLDTTKDSRCLNAQVVLEILWKYDLLSAYYLCYNNDRDSTIVYTLNPYTNYAPSPWVKLNASYEFTDEAEKKWTFYNLKYSKVLFSAALFVGFAKNEVVKEGEVFRANESLLREWMVKIKSPGETSYAFGLFIGANEFLTFSLPVESIKANQSLFVTNELQNPSPNNTNLHVNKKNVFFGLEFSKELNESQRPFALLKTDESVLPESEITNHTFIKVAQNLSDVDPTACFILSSKTSEEIEVIECPIRNPDSVESTDDYFSCSIDENDDEMREGGLFCYEKNQSGEISLVGLTSNGKTTIFATGETLKPVVNLIGLNITAINQLSVY